MKHKTFVTIFLAFGVVAMGQVQGFAQTEATIRDEAIGRLEEIYRAQSNYSIITTRSYPSSCPSGNVCWQGDVLSTVGQGNSHADLQSAFAACPANLSVSVGALGGDVRFRCRRQGAGPYDVLCFAYRCESASPAGCKQKWRLRFKPSGGAAVPLNCFDVEGTGVCTGAPASISEYFEECPS